MSVSTGTGHGGLAGVGSTSLMSIVEDVAKTNREAWGKAAAEEDLTTSTSSKSVGETIKPSGFLEAVKAPRSIDFEDLKEQMDRDLRENRGQNHHQHQAQYTGRARSGSDSAAAPHHEHDIGPSASASAPLLAAIPVINKNNSQAQDKLTPSTHKPGQAILPLRSALKNSSRTPSPMQRPPQSLPAVAGQSKQLGGSGESSSPSGSQLGSNVSTAGSSGSERSGKSGTVILAQHQPTRTASPLANSISVVPSQRDVKGKGKERLDDSAFAVLPGTIFSPPQSNLSTSTPSPSPATSMQTVYENPNKSTLMREQSGSGSDSGSDSSDAASISSYETGLEAFDDVVEDSGDETETGQGPSTPPPHEVAYHLNGGRSDVSSSSTSTSTLTQTQKELQNAIANTSIPGLTQSNTAVNSITIITHSSPPRRRKSVRVSLQPTYSVTPPAIEYEDEDEIGIGAEEHASDTDESEASGENRKSVHDERQTDGVARQDIWADSSDEDVEYQKARKLFSVSSALAKKSNGKKAKSTTHR
ncbi:hypothetical protein F5050DRAFT_1778950 [Lentinula boryana]|uniref:Uncharacterized protein n=1 Tax=Lentinula boryana TaxID=40481 RepID=A0ABQ8Q5R5_9AGAR|nr:hypothetical protein F5050DRAFT_1778950 [Lentinula boryana]